MTVQEKPYPVVSLVVDTFGEWLKHRRELREMRDRFKRSGHVNRATLSPARIAYSAVTAFPP